MHFDILLICYSHLNYWGYGFIVRYSVSDKTHSHPLLRGLKYLISHSRNPGSSSRSLMLSLIINIAAWCFSLSTAFVRLSRHVSWQCRWEMNSVMLHRRHVRLAFSLSCEAKYRRDEAHYPVIFNSLLSPWANFQFKPWECYFWIHIIQSCLMTCARTDMSANSANKLASPAIL